MARNETKHMDAVKALAEELNFTLAAQKLHISQPTITRILAEVEASVGARLFDRDRRSVSLNAVGKAYLAFAQIALVEADKALEAARTAAQQIDAVLHVGRSPYTDPFFVSTVQTVRLARFPKLRVEFSSQFSFDLSHDLISGSLDLAIANEPPESPLLTRVKIGETPFYIAMSEEDELAQQGAVSFDSLGGRYWIMWERRLHPPLYDSMMELAEKKKLRPRAIQHIIDPEEAVPFITEDRHLAIVVKAGALRICRNGVTIRPLAQPFPLLRTYLVSRADNPSHLLSGMVRAFMARLSVDGSKSSSATQAT